MKLAILRYTSLNPELELKPKAGNIPCTVLYRGKRSSLTWRIYRLFPFFLLLFVRILYSNEGTLIFNDRKCGVLGSKCT